MFKKIIKHLIPWSLFIALMNSESVGLAWGMFSRENGSILVPLMYGTAFGAVIFYLNIYYLIPKYYNNGGKLKYWLLGFVVFFGISLLEAGIDAIVLIKQNRDQLIMHLSESSNDDLMAWAIIVFMNVITSNFVCWIMAFAYKFPKDWLRNERQKHQLEQDRLRSELDFLKAQINPHFLFNGINSIYHLIGVDNEIAKSTLLQFSGLLRYQLYDCSVNYISLEKELNYIGNYIKIEEVRKGEDAIFTFNLPNIDEHESLKKYRIAPLLITPFLENAFKYLSHHSNKNKNFIKLDLTVSEDAILKMHLTNSYEGAFKLKDESIGGIGLVNVKRRLALLYPEGKHELQINHTENTYSVNLTLNL